MVRVELSDLQCLEAVFPLAGNYQVSPGQIYNKKPEKVKNLLAKMSCNNANTKCSYNIDYP